MSAPTEIHMYVYSRDNCYLYLSPRKIVESRLGNTRDEIMTRRELTNIINLLPTLPHTILAQWSVGENR